MRSKERKERDIKKHGEGKEKLEGKGNGGGGRACWRRETEVEEMFLLSGECMPADYCDSIACLSGAFSTMCT